MSRSARPVLIVDDDPDIREMLGTVLDVQGFAVAKAASGGAALSWLRTHPDVGMIVLDLMMPDMSGYEFRERQLSDPAIADIPTVVLTGSTLHSADRERLRNAVVLMKPVGVRTLLHAVERHLLA